MKQLVNFFRSSQRKTSSGPARRKPIARSLRPETLEKRELLAVDLLPAHNYVVAEDVNADFKVTSLDALLVINQVSRNGGSQSLAGVARGAVDRYYDTSGDNSITPLDALRVINRVARGEAVGEQIELIVNPRTANDGDFGSAFNAATRNLTVGVNEVFNLEVQYRDLRNQFPELGAFSIYSNILANEADTLEPALTETQFVRFAGNLGAVDSGNLRFSLAGGTATSTVSVVDFRANPAQALKNALAELGYDPAKVDASFVSSTGEFKIRYTDYSTQTDVDLPDLVVTPVNVVDSSGATVNLGPVVTSVPPRVGGAINQNAIPLNIDFRSRTFNNEAFYGTAIADGTFNAATGFVGVGGVGPLAAPSNSIPEPFDAFSIPVRVIKATTSLQVSLAPPPASSGSATGQDILLYGLDNPVPGDMVLVNKANDPSVATDGLGLLNITAVAGSVTVTAGNSALNFMEEGAQQTLDLSTLVTVSGSTAAPTFAITTPPARGSFTRTGSTITYTPAADDFTPTPSNLTFVYTATVGSTTGTGTVTINIAGVNDNPVPVADANLTATTAVTTTFTGSTLTTNDSPGPGETGTVTIAAVNAASAQGGTVTLTGQNIIYRSANGFTGEDTITYTISDGTLTTSTSVKVNVTPAATITINANNGNLSFNEDDAAKTLNLTTLTTVTGSTATPTFTITTQPARGTVSISGTTLTYTPAANDFTTTAAPLTLVYQAAIGSNNDTGTITIAIASVNDAPVVGADAARSTTVNTPLTVAISSLLANDSPGPANEGQTVSLATTPVPSATNGTVAVSGGNLVFTPNSGYTGPAVISYSITDGVASSAATLSVNVNPPAVVTVTAANSSLSFAEDGAARSLNLTSLTTVTNSTTAPTFAITTQPGRGTASLSGSTITYTPAANDFTTTGSPLVLVYSATVGSVSDTGTITITISSVNDAPVFVADTARSTTVNTQVTIPFAALLSNDSAGPANEGQTVSLATTPSVSATNGSVVVSGGNFVFTPTNGYVGLAVISYSITDGVTTAPATLSVNVTPAATVTVAADNSSWAFDEDDAAKTLNLTTITTVTNSTATPTFTIVSQPARGRLSLSGTTVSYKPADNDFTTTPLTFVYRAAVGSANDTGTVTITISAKNDVPTTGHDAVFARKDVATTFLASTFTGNDSAGPSNEGQTVTLTAVSAITGTNPTQGTVTLSAGNVVYTPPTGFTGTDRFTYTITDGVDTATGTVVVTVADFVPTTVSGSVFMDYLSTSLQRNQVQESSEPSVQGITVQLTSTTVAGFVTRTVVTDSLGRYSFADLQPGTYRAALVIPNDGTVTVDDDSIASADFTIPSPGAATFTGPKLSVAAINFEVVSENPQPKVGSDFLVVSYVPRSTAAADTLRSSSTSEGEGYRNAVDEVYGSGGLF